MPRLPLVFRIVRIPRSHAVPRGGGGKTAQAEFEARMRQEARLMQFVALELPGGYVLTSLRKPREESGSGSL